MFRKRRIVGDYSNRRSFLVEKSMQMHLKNGSDLGFRTRCLQHRSGRRSGVEFGSVLASNGGPFSNIEKMNLELFSRSIGYNSYFYLDQESMTLKTIKAFLKSRGPSFLEVKIKIDKSENKLPRPKD